MTSPRDRLLQAARTVVARDGLEGLSLRAIARQAGVSHGAPLRHFPTLGGLLAALAAEGFRDLTASIDEALTDAGASTTPRARLARSGAAYVRFALEDPGVFGVMFRPERIDTADPGYVEAASTSFQQLVDLVAAAQEEGWRADIPSDRLAVVLWANVHGLAQLWLQGAVQATVEVDDVHELLPLATELL